MAVLVTNDGADPYLLPDRRTIAPGDSVIVSDEELRLIPDSKRGTGKLLISAVEYASPIAVTGSLSLAPPAQYTTLLDDAGFGITYVGEALPGTDTSAASWRIKQITDASPDLAVEWADGNADFDNVWDDRASLIYS